MFGRKKSKTSFFASLTEADLQQYRRHHILLAAASLAGILNWVSVSKPELQKLAEAGAIEYFSFRASFIAYVLSFIVNVFLCDACDKEDTFKRKDGEYKPAEWFRSTEYIVLWWAAGALYICGLSSSVVYLLPDAAWYMWVTVFAALAYMGRVTYKVSIRSEADLEAQKKEELSLMGQIAEQKLLLETMIDEAAAEGIDISEYRRS